LFSQSEIVYVDNLSAGTTYKEFNVDTKQYVTNALELYKTHVVGDNTFELETSPSATVTLVLPGGNCIRVDESSEFRIDGYAVKTKEFHYPANAIVESINLSMSVSKGSVQFVIKKQTESDKIVLQTPVSNVELESGRYSVQIESSSVILYIIDGRLNVFDNITGKKELIKAGNVVLLHPTPILSPRQKELFSNRISTTAKTLTVDQLKDVSDENAKLNDSLKSVMFVNTSETNTIGVKLQ
jgi:hypothetical protein